MLDKGVRTGNIPLIVTHNHTIFYGSIFTYWKYNNYSHKQKIIKEKEREKKDQGTKTTLQSHDRLYFVLLGFSFSNLKPWNVSVSFVFGIVLHFTLFTTYLHDIPQPHPTARNAHTFFYVPLFSKMLFDIVFLF